MNTTKLKQLQRRLLSLGYDIRGRKVQPATDTTIQGNSITMGYGAHIRIQEQASEEDIDRFYHQAQSVGWEAGRHWDVADEAKGATIVVYTDIPT